MSNGARSTRLVTGYAAAPAGTSMHAVYGACGVVFEVDVETHCVVAAEFTVVTGLANQFLQRICVGANLLEDVGSLADNIRDLYLAPSRTALTAAVRAAAQRYTDYAHQLDTDDAADS